MDSTANRPVIEFEDVVVFKGPPRNVGDYVGADVRSVLFVPNSTYLVIQHGRALSHRFPNVPVILERGRFSLVEEARIVSAHVEGVGTRTILDDDPELVAIPLNDALVEGSSFTEPVNEPPFLASAQVVGWLDKIKRDDLERLTHSLSSYRTRHSQSPEFDNAVNLIRDWMESFGYDVEKVPVLSGPLPITYNLVATRPGRSESALRTIVCAHLDSISHEPNSTLASPAPGALDNASGCAALIAIAYAMRAQLADPGASPGVEIDFVLFGDEEVGRAGSAAYVAELGAKGSQIHSVLNLDMPTPLVANGVSTILLDPHPWEARWITDQLSASAATYVSRRFETLRLTGAGNVPSDHAIFGKDGWPATLVTESENLNPIIHSKSDVASALDYDALEAVTKMCCAWVAHVMLGDFKPPEAEETP